MAKKVLPSQVRGQRISREELIAEARAELDSSGVNNSLRAEFIAELAPYVSHNPTPILCQQQPKVRPFPDRFWEAAHQLVADYLFENRLELTVKTASVEFAAFPKGHITASSSSAQLSDLAQPRDEECFSDRVKKQGEARKLPPPPEPAAPPPPEESPKKSPAPRPARKKAAADGDKPGKTPPARRGKGKAPPAKGKGTTANASSGHGDDDSANLNEGD
jgi:hypothetical protein